MIKEKKKGLLLIVLMFGITILSAQVRSNSITESKILVTKVPKVIAERFTQEYLGIKPVWYKVGEKYEATYLNNSTKLNHNITYDKFGSIITKETELDYKEYPATINQYYSRRFPDEKYRIIQCEASNGEKFYYSKRKNEILKFDTNGSYISTR